MDVLCASWLRTRFVWCAFAGFDIFARTEAPYALVQVIDSVSLVPSGLGLAMLQQASFNTTLQNGRPVLFFPGSQTIVGGVGTVCRKASILHNAFCWGANHSYVMEEVILEGMELYDDSPKAASTGYWVSAKNTLNIVNLVVTLECVRSQGTSHRIFITSKTTNAASPAHAWAKLWGVFVCVKPQHLTQCMTTTTTGTQKLKVISCASP